MTLSPIRKGAIFTAILISLIQPSPAGAERKNIWTQRAQSADKAHKEYLVQLFARRKYINQEGKNRTNKALLKLALDHSRLERASRDRDIDLRDVSPKHWAYSQTLKGAAKSGELIAAALSFTPPERRKIESPKIESPDKALNPRHDTIANAVALVITERLSQTSDSEKESQLQNIGRAFADTIAGDIQLTHKILETVQHHVTHGNHQKANKKLSELPAVFEIWSQRLDFAKDLALGLGAAHTKHPLRESLAAAKKEITDLKSQVSTFIRAQGESALTANSLAQLTSTIERITGQPKEHPKDIVAPEQWASATTLLPPEPPAATRTRAE